MDEIKFIDLTYQNRQIEQELNAFFKSFVEAGTYIGGKVLHDFETAFASYLGVNHCVGCGNCTDALEIILRAYNIGEGDEVIIPAFNMPAGIEAVLAVGATPVLADILPLEHTLSPDDAADKITARTKAIIPVHMYGLPARMNEFVKLGQQHGIKIIEDGAQAHGAVYHGKKVGSIGDAAAFSFYPTKNLGALGDGGAICTNDPELAEKARMIANHGQQSKNNHVLVGRNSRLDPLQAGVLSIKLNHLDDWNDMRRDLASLYNREFDSKPVGVEIEHVYHIYTIQVDRRYEVRKMLKASNIGTSIHYPYALHQLEPYSTFYNGSLPVAENLAERQVSLPVFPGLLKDDVRTVSRVLKELTF